MTRFPWRLVTFDIDGTLTQGHGWRFLAERTGRLDAYRESNRRFLARETGEDAHLRELLDLAVGLTRPEVAAILEATPRIGRIAEGVAALRARGSRVALLSHNPEYVCAWYRDRFGFDDAAGTRGTAFVGGRIAPYGAVHASKLDGLAGLLDRAGATRGETAHVGDGWADAVVFRRVGGGVALNSALPEVRAAADLALSIGTLPEIVDPLAALSPRRVD